MKKLILIFLGIGLTLFSNVPIIKINITAPSYIEIINATIYDSIIESGKFKLYLQDELEKLYKELRLQDLLSNKNLILKESKQPIINFDVVIKNLQIKEEKIKKDYIVNNESGDYIRVGEKYIKVQKGIYYSYDVNTSRYIPSKEGYYIKGYDGNFYTFNNFYTKFSHEEIVYKVSGKVYYNLFGYANGSFSFSKEIKKRWYKWDETILKALKKENSQIEILKYIASVIKSNILENIKNAYKLEGIIYDLKKDRVILNIGKKDGVLPGTVFTIAENKGQIVIRNVENNYSEAEFYYLKKHSKIEIGDQVVEESKKIFIPISLGIYYTSNGLKISFGLRQRDVYNDKKAFLVVDYLTNTQNYIITLGYNIFDFYELKTYLLLSNDFSIGGMIKYDLFDLMFNYSLQNKTFNFGGGFSW